MFCLIIKRNLDWHFSEYLYDNFLDNLNCNFTNNLNQFDYLDRNFSDDLFLCYYLHRNFPYHLNYPLHFNLFGDNGLYRNLNEGCIFIGFIIMNILIEKNLNWNLHQLNNFYDSWRFHNLLYPENFLPLNRRLDNLLNYNSFRLLNNLDNRLYRYLNETINDLGLRKRLFLN